MRTASLPPLSRLPVDHPEYRYAPSRNPYWKKLKEMAGGIVFTDNDTESRRGEWRAVLPDAAADPRREQGEPPRRELHVEIGCNAGHVIIEWARANPGIAYVGIDWKFKPIARCVEKAAKHGLKNALFFRAHAERLTQMFGPGEIDRLCLYFPDPWPRKSQWKYRFLTARRLREAAQVIRKGGIFHIKTDHRGYFDWMEEAVAETRELWEIVDRSTDLHAGHPDPESLTMPEVTLFERLFIKDKIPINSLTLRVK